jgi:hypothetical protein
MSGHNSAVAFDLIDEAVEESSRSGAASAAGIFTGCAIFFGGDWLIDASAEASGNRRVRDPHARLTIGGDSPSPAESADTAQRCPSIAPEG